jgi:hypothetical protein
VADRTVLDVATEALADPDTGDVTMLDMDTVHDVLSALGIPLDMPVSTLRNLANENERLRGELADADAAIDAARERDLWAIDGQTCGCMYDRPEDVCMHHSPAVRKLEVERNIRIEERDAALAERDALSAQLAELQAENERLRLGSYDGRWVRVKTEMGNDVGRWRSIRPSPSTGQPMFDIEDEHGRMIMRTFVACVEEVEILA